MIFLVSNIIDQELKDEFLCFVAIIGSACLNQGWITEEGKMPEYGVMALLRRHTVARGSYWFRGLVSLGCCEEGRDAVVKHLKSLCISELTGD